ncbi:iron ABC transporter permease [Cutibacterium equinum]|uniref:Iron ABC transporter permease n=1 Tax=Cutibacterium equinum TaxID=3016342 RepID=A0ABY7QZI3_9ACTN|nr:iron ABC transporter permease [Cutibacterium equinum]WCC80455.1 iron ABC transporter permease [Cutibacterium equinum]
MTSADGGTRMVGAAAEGSASATAQWYRLRGRRKTGIIVGLVVLLVAVSLVDFLLGGGSMPARDVLATVMHPAQSRPIDHEIVFDIRLPMTVTAVLVGGALAAAGSQMQTILGNPLAEPYTLGVSAAAGFGAALATVSGFTATDIGAALGMAGTAWLFAMLACGIILLFSRFRGPGAETMILLGIAIVFFFDALLALMQYLASETQLEQVVFWTMGSLTRATWPQIALLSVVTVAGLVFFYRNAWSLTAFRMGDDRARALGVHVDAMRTVTLLVVSFIAATAVAMAGTIGFIGLVGPHVARMIVGEDQRYFLTTSAIAGSLLLVGASAVSKIIQPGVILPVGIITAIVGVPVYVLIITSKRGTLWAS